MKKLLIAAIAAFGIGFGTASYAGDFDNTAITTTVTSGSLQFTFENTFKDGLTKFEVGSYLYSYNLGKATADIYAELGYDRIMDTLNVRGEYQVGMPVNDRVGVYGALAFEYAAPTRNLGMGFFYFDPNLGASYSFNEDALVFGEVGYKWNLSNSTVNNGGYVEIGVDYHVNDRLMVTPSIIRTFDTGNDSTQAKLGITFSF